MSKIFLFQENLSNLLKSFPSRKKKPKSTEKSAKELTKKGKLIGPNDMLIAVTALANGAVLVTHNTDEFSRVPELELEDWIK